MKTLKIALAQMDPTPGDISGNTEKIISNIKSARAKGAKLVVFPELAITGLRPGDLLKKPRFIAENIRAMKKITLSTSGIAAVVGFVDSSNKGIYNAAALMHHKKLMYVVQKQHLTPEEAGYFMSGTEAPLFNISGDTFGISIADDPLPHGAEVIVNLNSSAYVMGELKTRERVTARDAKRSSSFIVTVNPVGYVEEALYEGGSFIVNPHGQTIARAKQFSDELLIKKLVNKRKPETPKLRPLLKRPEEVYSALVLGVRDYFAYNNFPSAILGLSGGIDSALTAAIAVDALGKKNVYGVTMPSEFTSIESKALAKTLARNLGIKLMDIPIAPAKEAFNSMFEKAYKGTKSCTAEENIQARIRGNILMSLSNKFGHVVVTTGNKSEAAMGYATLYGDTAGGFSVLKDVTKTLVYELARWRNRQGKKAVIPKAIITREPTAELRHAQKDSDTLPPYEVLDKIVLAYIEEGKSRRELTRELGLELKFVTRVIKTIEQGEHKRRQCPSGILISKRGFGRNWNLPITNRY